MSAPLRRSLYVLGAMILVVGLASNPFAQESFGLEEKVEILWDDFCERKPDHHRCQVEPTPEPSPEPTEEPTPDPTPGPTPTPDPKYGPRSVSCPSGAVNVSPGQLSQTLVNSHSSGTAFCVRNGTHDLPGELSPKSGMQFWGESLGAVLDGRNTVGEAFGGDATGVILKGLTIRNFRTGPSDNLSTTVSLRSGWVVEDSVIEGGTRCLRHLGANATSRHNLVRSCANYGAWGHGGLFEANEFVDNGGIEDPGGSTGATKFNHSVGNGLTLRANWFYGNHGAAAIWPDYNNQAVIEDNLVEDNDGIGIFYEYNTSANNWGIIRRNVVRNNGKGSYKGRVWLDSSISYGANLTVLESNNVEVYDNTVIATNGWHGISVRDDSRSGAISGITVNDNEVRFSIADGTAAAAIGATMTSSNVRYDRNTYRVPDTQAYWAHAVPSGSTTATWEKWLSHGQDPNGMRVIE
jgi:hypothetical protein